MAGQSSDPDLSPHTHNRRTFLGAAGAAVALTATGWTPAFSVPAASAASTLATPPGFPASIPLSQQAFQNWSEQITIENAWTATPATPQDVVTIANWAHGAGYRVRPRGMGHNWSPLVLPNGADTSTVLMVDTTAHLTAIAPTAGSVTVQAGATVDALTLALEQAGYGLLECTAPGDLTIGGVLAIGGHGSGVPASGETRPTGASYGSLSNLVLSLTAVVWNGTSYALRTFSRTDADIGAFLVHLGRAFVTEVTLQTIPNQRLRCQNWFDIQASDLFGAPGSNSNTLDSYLTRSGRVEAIWFPFTGPPWLKVWTVTPTKPLLSLEIDAPYPYTFANFVNQQESDFIKEVVQGDVSGTPAFENTEMAIVGSGLITTGTWDVWGWSRNALLYVQPTTLRIVEAGWAVLTARSGVQQVLNQFYLHYQSLVTTYQNNGQYPVNGPVEIRITGLDQPSEVTVAGAVPPALSAIRPRPDHPEWNTCVWLDIGTLPDTPAAAQFYTDMETWIWATFTGTTAMVRPEWSKAWAHTSAGAWTNTQIIGTTIPNAFRAGLPSATNWDATVATLNNYDPAHIYSNPFLETLM